MELIELYKSIQKFAGMSSDDKGFVVTTDKKEPVFINKDRLVLPVPYQLRENMDPDRIVFHPLADNILQGESKVIVKLKHNINVRLNQAIALLGQYLLTIAGDETLHPRLSPEQLRFVTSIKAIDDKVAEKWGTLAASLMKETPDRAYINIFLCRGGTIGTTKYSRVGVTSFPLYDKLVKDNGESLKIREMDKLPFRQLIEVIFDEIDVSQAYDAGSHSNFAPYLQALMLTAAGIAGRLNDVLRVFRGVIEDDEATAFIASFTSELAWLEPISKMEELGPEIRKVPPQKDGPVGAMAAPAPVVNNSPVPNPVAPVAPPMAAPQVIPMNTGAAAPAPSKSANGLSIKGFLSSAQQPQQQQMMPMAPAGAIPGQVMMQQVMTPQGIMMVPVQQMPQQQMQPMNPWMIQQQQQQMQQMQPSVPTWAQVPPEQVMVMTPRGVMNQAIAMQLGLQYQPLPQQNQGPMNNGRPTWA